MTDSTVPAHGTRNRYQRLACRCSDCRLANTLYERDYRSGRQTAHSAVVTRVEDVVSRQPPLPYPRRRRP